MQRASLAENDVYALSPSKARWASPEKRMGVSPFKRGGGGVLSGKSAASTSRAGRSAFGDKTNQSPSPRKLTSPSKTPFFKPVSSALVTPAGNIGRAGQLKAHLAQMYDTEHDVSEEAPRVDDVVPDDELYPEIEYMPPAQSIPYDFDLDGLPRAKDAARMLRKPCVGTWQGTGIEPGVRESDLALQEPDAAVAVEATSASTTMTTKTSTREARRPAKSVPARPAAAPYKRVSSRPPMRARARPASDALAVAAERAVRTAPTNMFDIDTN